ncbi:MAG: rhodanese-related sulfurtransferase [Myxococcota bacterium]|nr:rhodanese-related sulfurtransferase [Myxococcota bacterium]
MSHLVAALYKFHPIPDPEALRAPLLAHCQAQGVRGILLLAREGLNGTISGPPEGIQAVLDWLRAIPGFADLQHKESHAHQAPFARMKVRIKQEIVTMGVPDADPLQGVGTYLPPREWDALLADPDTVLIDTRNDYEVAIGTFKGAIDPDIESFRAFPQWIQDHREQLEGKNIAMFCTGGIRCERATAWMKAQGFEKVFHLEGGILRYLEQTPAQQSNWEGECFVFDRRIALNHDLEPGDWCLCGGCRWPLGAQDRLHPDYEEGVSCAHCARSLSDHQRASFRERQKQINLARERGQVHQLQTQAE